MKQNNNQYRDIKNKIRDDVWKMDLSMHCKLMLLCIASHYNSKSGSCTLKDGTIARECSMSTKTVGRCRQQLIDFGAIKIRKGNYGIINYQLRVDRESTQSGQRVQSEWTESPTQYNPITNPIYNPIKKDYYEREDKDWDEYNGYNLKDPITVENKDSDYELTKGWTF